MLANGITLWYNKNATMTKLLGLQEVPEIGMDPEKVEVTTLDDVAKQYEFGIGDYGDLEFTFKYDNSSVNTSYRTLRALSESKAVTQFEMRFPDGTKFSWNAMVNVKLSGGGVNGAITFKCSMALQSAITTADPDALLTLTIAKGTTATATKVTVNRAANQGSLLFVKCGAGLTAPTVGATLDMVTLNGYTQYVSASTDIACAAADKVVVIEVRPVDRMVVAASVPGTVVVGP